VQAAANTNTTKFIAACASIYWASSTFYYLKMLSMHPPLNVLFLCTHNSARSILAEALLNHWGQGRFKGFSAGSSPRVNQLPNPLGLQALREAGIATDGLYSKSWDVFARPDAPHMDLVITVCDNAAGEVCPFWPGSPASAHWSYADPSAGDAPDAQKLLAFKQTLQAIQGRIAQLVNLPPENLQPGALQNSARGLAAA
jgi:arsenate reductase (thioredoxin)